MSDPELAPAPAADRRRARPAGAAAAAGADLAAPTPSSGMPRAAAPASRSRRSTASIWPLLQGIDRSRDILLDNTRRFAERPPRQQRAAVGRARHGQELARQGGPRHGRTRERDPRRRLVLIEIHREDIEIAAAAAAPAARQADRRCLLFCDDLSFDGERHQLQIAEGGARGRHRGPAGQRPVLCHLEPAPPDAARHDRERALHRDQPVARRSRRKSRCPTASACGSASTPAARTTISRWSSGYAAPFRARRAERRTARPRRSNGPRRAAPAPAASPGSSSRTCAGRLGRRPPEG